MQENNNVMIKVGGLKKTFSDDGKQVLCGVDLVVKKGEKVVILGPSGSGKSTFLRSLNLLEEATSGKVYFEDVDITNPKININKQFKKKEM